MKPRSFLTSALLMVTFLLTVVSGCLYRQNRSYESRNRELIIQNDSILSVNIELSQFIRAGSRQKASLK
jgi:hypothetical protein